jgi:predicted ferric reductase
VKLATRAVVWVLAYLGVVVAPLVFAVIGSSQPHHGFWTNFSVALGFTGLAMMGLEFALVARSSALAWPFGQDALLQFHRQIGYIGLGFILGHFAISAKWNELTVSQALASPRHSPRRSWCGSGWPHYSRSWCSSPRLSGAS